jgi:LysM repeat protein
MNNQNQSPLVPSGSMLEQKQKSRAKVKIAVFVVLAVHGVGLLALLLQGCKKDDAGAGATGAGGTAGAAAERTNDVVTPTFAASTNVAPPPATPATPASTTPATAATGTAAPATPTTDVPPAIPGVTPTATDYKIASGDNFSTLAKKFHVTTKALVDANPGVEATKLQINQVIHIPPPAAPAPVATATGATGTGTGAATGSAVTADPATGDALYSVKSGDTLTSIAHEKKVSIKTLRSVNNLKTDRITVGQKLKIPAAKATASTTTDTGTPMAASTTVAHSTVR